jgi:tRNA(Ile)-lysidine synthetase-like protein
MNEHLGYEKSQVSDNKNARNGHSTKKIKTSFGENEIQVPRDRDGSFNPIVVPKRRNMIDGLENIILSFYAKGMSVSDIQEQIKDLYEFEVSTSAISRITDRVTNDIVSWQNRPLEPIYLIVWMDGIVFKVRENSKVINKTIYISVGLRRDGKKEVLGLWLGKNESAAFWMTVLTDLRARGVEDILITATDNLNGFTDTIKSVFPKSATQICVVHQIRNACKYVVWKDRKEFASDMKDIYGAPNREAAAHALDALDKKWNSKYSYAIKSWRTNWDELTVFFDFPLEIRKYQDGDWFCPLGMNAKKLISDFLTDKKVPLNIKKNTQILLSRGSVVWIMGHRIDNRNKVSDKTETVMILEMRNK